MQISDSIDKAFSQLPRTPERGGPVKFLAVPGHEATRWLIPVDGSRLDSVLANWSPYRLCSRVKWHAIRSANALGVLKLLPSVGTVELQNARDVDWRAVGWNEAEAPAFVMYIGTPGPAQKAVVHLVSRRSLACDAILKIPLASEARDTILREAATLTALANERYARAPQLLALDSEHGTSMQRFIAGKPGKRQLSSEYLDLLRSLMLPEERTTLATHACEYERQLTTVPEAHLEQMRAALTELADEAPLPTCWVHGDFAPWNIRQRTDLPPALIDWEEGKRGGLPLFDAYHFLHIQDFLFRNQPRLHAAELTNFGQRLGLSSPQCQKLEIAYLAETYLQCSARQDESRARFLLASLAMALAQRQAAISFPKAHAHRLHLIQRDTDAVRRARAELFDSLVATLNQEGLAYCILSGYQRELEPGESDVDIMLREEDRRRMPELLARVARATGALLVQALQHETTATYFILVHARGDGIAHLDVDCYGDYRRDARTWLLADKVIASRRKYRSFNVPSVADEFTYYLIKKVLKQSIAAHQLLRLQHLLARNPVDCQAAMARFWPSRALLLQRSIATQDLGWFRQQLPWLYSELQSSRRVESIVQRSAGKLTESARCWRRVVHPTGMWVEVAGGEWQQRTQVAGALAQRLRPAFRRSRIAKFRGGLATSLALLSDRIRSTLVVSIADEFASTVSSPALRRVIRKLTGCFVGPDLVVLLEAERGMPNQRPAPQGKVLGLKASADTEGVFQQACQAVLQRLASRLDGRLHLRPSTATGDESRAMSTGQAELSSAGSD